MEKIVTIELFGTIHKFKAEDSDINVKEVADFLVKEVTEARNKLPSKYSNTNKFALLLLAALNISSKYFELKRDHDDLIHQIATKSETLLRTIDDHIAASKTNASSSIHQTKTEEPGPSDLSNRPPSEDAESSGCSAGESPEAPAEEVSVPATDTPQEQMNVPASDPADMPPVIQRLETILPQQAEPENSKPVYSGSNTEDFTLPPISFLDAPDDRPSSVDPEYLKIQSELLENKLNDFGVKGQVVKISPGPVITTFEYKPAPGVKISKIVNLTDDLALALSAISIRIVAPIPGKDVIGIEIPNAERKLVHFREIVDSNEFKQSKSKLTLCLGKDIIGNPVTAAMDKMPHLLIAGATGTGKSVGLNAMITSLLYKATPDEVKLLMIDPKRIELSFYNGIPHLISPVVTDMKKATNALFWALREMEKRYDLLAENKVRNIKQYNKKVEKGEINSQDAAKLPYIVIIIDELADLMMVSSRDVEVSLTRLAQMARAAGIHLVLATQRPSVDVLTGVIKANFPTRISFQVSSKIDSRTIIDTNGAENLLGNGDMLFLPPGTAKLRRIHGAYISETELTKITSFLKEQMPPEYIEEVTESTKEQKTAPDKDDYDERYDEAVALVTKTRQASISSIQRHLRIGYNRAARMIDIMEKEGIVGPSDGAKPREVLVKNYDEIS